MATPTEAIIDAERVTIWNPFFEDSGLLFTHLIQMVLSCRFVKIAHYPIIISEGENHMKTLEELYYGNIAPFDYAIPPDGEQRKLMTRIVRYESDLVATLNDAQQGLFDHFKVCVEELHQLTASKAFSDGFSLAAKIMMEVMEEA